MPAWLRMDCSSTTRSRSKRSWRSALICTPASGWEKGQVENQVNLVRERFFTPRLRFKSYDELNGWLLDKCISYARAHKHVDQTERTIWEVFDAERPHLVGYAR